MVEVFNLRTNELLGKGCSQPICDSSSKVRSHRKYSSVFTFHNSHFACHILHVLLKYSSLTFPPKRSTVLWSSTQHFPCAVVQRVAERYFFSKFPPLTRFQLFSLQGIHGVRQRPGKGRGAEVPDLPPGPAP